MFFWFNSPVNFLMKQQSDSHLFKSLKHFMMAFYCITLNMLIHYVILCFRITKLEDDPQ